MWIALSLFCAGAVKGIFGMGLPAVWTGHLEIASAGASEVRPIRKTEPDVGSPPSPASLP